MARRCTAGVEATGDALVRPDFTPFSPPRRAQGASVHAHMFDGAAPVPAAQSQTHGKALGCPAPVPVRAAVAPGSHAWRVRPIAGGSTGCGPRVLVSSRHARRGVWFSRLLTVKIRQPSHEFTFGVGMTFVSYSLVLTPVQWRSQDLKVGYSRPSPTEKEVHTSQGKYYGSFQYQTSKK
jgi:hypothetical protein